MSDTADTPGSRAETETAGDGDDDDEAGADATERSTADWWRLGPDESRVPPDREGPVAECPYCGRPFEESRARTLHVGEVHRERATEAEREAYEEADAAEVDDLFVYHLKAVVVIGLAWAGFVVLYMVAIGSNVI